ncbi:hypothetical protein FB45DRAFT_1054466 [Roridomyces roridus]|uniref:Uncharacterized protein n=1 Tax=Roridomyces roridus TaxID=1738132 RepID=A0AAD7CB42_9AGAR|nr:hypothetical protein FB45DRAFT_1054466 [Roridomyces roridus]
MATTALLEASQAAALATALTWDQFTQKTVVEGLEGCAERRAKQGEQCEAGEAAAFCVLVVSSPALRPSSLPMPVLRHAILSGGAVLLGKRESGAVDAVPL